MPSPTRNFQNFVNEAGGGDGFLFLGPKVTPEITSKIEFGSNSYGFTLKPTASGSLLIASETTGHRDSTNTFQSNQESILKSIRDQTSYSYPGRHGVGYYIYDSVSSWTVYHFHDTSPLAPVRRDQAVEDTQRFRHNASNIAPFLLGLKEEEPGSYELIRDTVRLIAPFVEDFLLRPRMRGTSEQVRLEWLQKGSDIPFQPNQLSDGTIRFICLAVALLQPTPPATIVIDEPELGLHPFAISMLADLIKSASERTQVIISTQSPTLLDNFEPSDVVVVNRREGRTTLERLDSQALAGWLEEYSVGELWQKNVVHGGPTHE